MRQKTQNELAQNTVKIIGKSVRIRMDEHVYILLVCWYDILLFDILIPNGKSLLKVALIR